MAKVALLYSAIFGHEAYESLLSFMRTEKNDVLDEVTSDFVEISGNLTPPIELFCAYEQVPTDYTKFYEKFAQNAPSLLQNKFFRASAQRILDKGFSALGAGTVSGQLSLGSIDLMNVAAFCGERIRRVGWSSQCRVDCRSQ